MIVKVAQILRFVERCFLVIRKVNDVWYVEDDKHLVVVSSLEKAKEVEKRFSEIIQNKNAIYYE